jgi:serine protease Do
MMRNLFISWVAVIFFGFFVAHVSAKDLPDFTELVQKQGAVVVNISTVQSPRNNRNNKRPPGQPREGDPFSEFFHRFAPPMPRGQPELQSRGSGFVISADGYILTNAHVVGGADGVTVSLNDKREFSAKIIGIDKRTDLALLKIDATGLPKITQGNPEELKVGEWVIAIGSPFGFDSSVTAGIVSAKGRTLPQENFVPFIQTDAAINPGNSGGPLFNMKGEVVGINSQIYTRTGGFMGLSFSIPIDVAMNVANQLRSTGKVTRGRIGVVIQEVTRDLAESFGLSSAAGALVSNVENGSAAEKAGIQVSDVILKFDGKTVSTSLDLPRIVAATKPDSKVTVQLWRKNESRDVSLIVGVMPDDSVVAKIEDSGEESSVTSTNVVRLGLALSPLTDEQKKELGIKNGLLVEEVLNPEVSELRTGDVILAIGNIEIGSVDNINEVLKRVPKGKNVALLVRRGEQVSYVAVKLDIK